MEPVALMHRNVFRSAIAATALMVLCFAGPQPTRHLYGGEQVPLIEVHQDFSRDPGWESVNNRVECGDCPHVVQDLGWSPASHTGQQGEVGGKIWQSTTPAYYGMPIGRPLTFRDSISASGRIAFARTQGQGAAYLGFFNSQRQGWRPWSSLGIRFVANDVFTDEWSTQPSKAAIVMIDYMNGQWGAGGRETDIRLPADSSSHSWRLTYDPEATPAPWTDSHLRDALRDEKRQTAEQVYERLRKPEPEVTLQAVRDRLRRALAGGHIACFPRGEGLLWAADKEAGEARGAITVQFDNDQPYSLFLVRERRDAPVALNRFGIFNVQVYHRWIEFYVSDLTINGHKIDLSRDPRWDGAGNHVEFIERDFQRQNFGYSETNWAGKQTGEIGGTFARSEPKDPLHGYYADDVGALTLDDPISFSGSVSFVDGATDAGMFIGYFNRHERMRPMTDPDEGSPLNDTLGIEIDGPTRIGYYFSAMCSPKRDLASKKEGPIFRPTGDRHSFRFRYDPKENNGAGRVTVTLDESEFALNVTAKQRAAGARFDRFGIMNPRRGGKYVTVYFDDLTYTARRAADYRPIHHDQKITIVPYPRGGRQY